MIRTMVLMMAAVVVAAVQGCAAKLPRNADETLRISQKEITVLVDSSLTAPKRGSTTWISVPDNGSIAVEAEKAAEGALGAKGYKIGQPVLVSVGAWFPADQKVRVQKASQEQLSPDEISKPFIVWPGVSGEPMKKKINDLFAGTNRTPIADPRPSLDIFPTDGVLLVSCWGDLSDRARVQFMLIDRASGKIAWQEQGSVSTKTPETFGKEVRKMLGELPAAGGRSKQ